MKMLATLLITLGIVAFAYPSVGYKTQEDVVNLGTVPVTTEKSHSLPLPPIAGAIALASGIGLLVVSTRKN